MARRKQGTPHPSIPANGSEMGVYDEPVVKMRPDVLPPGDLRREDLSQATRSSLRLRIEALLEKREAIAPREWNALGPNVTEQLQIMLSDGALRPALRQRVIIALGQIAGDAAVSKLGDILTNQRESPIDRAYAATALGNVHNEQAVATLGRGVADQDAMVRRQVAYALSRSGTPQAVPFLRTLAGDKLPSVAEYAVRALDKPRGKASTQAPHRRKRKARPNDSQ